MNTVNALSNVQNLVEKQFYGFFTAPIHRDFLKINWSLPALCISGSSFESLSNLCFIQVRDVHATAH